MPLEELVDSFTFTRFEPAGTVQCVRHDVGGALPVDDGEVEVGEEFQPVGLTLGKVRLGVDVADGPVVRDDGEVATLEVVAPEGEALNDGEELTLVGEVFELGGGVTCGVVGDDSLGGTGALCEASA